VTAGSKKLWPLTAGSAARMTVGWETSSQALADLARVRAFNPAKHIAFCGKCGARSNVGVITHEPDCDAD
jgi:hypothetical protein